MTVFKAAQKTAPALGRAENTKNSSSLLLQVPPSTVCKYITLNGTHDDRKNIILKYAQRHS
jgi:hypothetical protein